MVMWKFLATLIEDEDEYDVETSRKMRRIPTPIGKDRTLVDDINFNLQTKNLPY